LSVVEMTNNGKGKSGRPAGSGKLTSEIQKVIVTAIENGNQVCVACQLAGIDTSTYHRWLKLGKESESGIYRDFYNALKKAESDAESFLICRIREAAEGTQTIKRKYVFMPDGSRQLSEENIAVDSHWQAAAWFLERRYPDRWSRKRMDLLDALAALVDANIAPPELMEAAREGMGDLKEKLRTAFKGALPL
jgi:hypothetical protein